MRHVGFLNMDVDLKEVNIKSLQVYAKNFDRVETKKKKCLMKSVQGKVLFYLRISCLWNLAVRVKTMIGSHFSPLHIFSYLFIFLSF